MSFEIKRLDDRGWAVFDENDKTVFTGSLFACRQWFDLNENVTSGGRSGANSSRMRSLFRTITLRTQPQDGK